jgi:hypothetical protein
MGLAIQRLDGWQHGAEREVIGCVRKLDSTRVGWKCRPVELVEGTPVLGTFGVWLFAGTVLSRGASRS